MISAKNLTKRYGKHEAIKDLTFDIEKGEITGFLGPNGAGKSTTMNIITGYLSTSEGSVTVDGLDVLEYPEEVKSKIGYLPEQPPLYFDMTVKEYLLFVGELKKVSKVQFKQDIEKIYDLVKIADHSDRLIKNLSKGYKQRVGLAQALIGNPSLLILDEPTVGLDPKQIIEIRSLIKSLREDHSIVLSSHILPEVSLICERVIIINEGIIVASDSPDNLSKRLLGSNKLSLRVIGNQKEIGKALSSVPGVVKIDYLPSQEDGAEDVMIEAGTDQDIRKSVFDAVAKAKLSMLQMRPMDMSLEDIFLHVTTSEKEAE